MVGNVDGGLFHLIANKLSLILNVKDFLVGSIDLLRLLYIPNPELYRSRIALFAVFADVFEERGCLAIAVNFGRALKLSLAPAIVTAMKMIRRVVCCKRVGFAIQVIDLGIRDTVRNSANGLSKVWRVVLLVKLGRRKPLYDVLSVNGELLDNGTQWEKGKSLGGRHGELFKI